MGFNKKQASKGGKISKRGLGKKTEQWEKFALWFMTDGMDRLQTEMAKLQGPEFIKEVKDLMEYFQPKLSRSEIKAEIQEVETIDLSAYEIKDLKKSIESYSPTDTKPRLS